MFEGSHHMYKISDSYDYLIFNSNQQRDLIMIFHFSIILLRLTRQKYEECGFNMVGNRFRITLFINVNNVCN